MENIHKSGDHKTSKKILQSREIKSSPVFQMLLYYNVWFSIAYFFISLLMIRYKGLNDSGWRIKFVSPAIFVLWSLAETGRLHVGYVGNIEEKSPMFPIDVIFAYIYLLFIAVEFLVGGRATHIILKDKKARFAVEFGALDPEFHEQTRGARLAAAAAGGTSSVSNRRLHTN